MILNLSDAVLPLVHELLPPPSPADAVDAFAGWPRLMTLESTLRRPELGRFSLLSADPLHWWETARTTFGVNPLAAIRQEFARFLTPPLPELPPFQGGILGMIGYEAGGVWERLPARQRDEFQIPDLAAGLYDWTIVWDHQRKRAWIVSHGWPETDPVRAKDRAAFRLTAVLAALNAPREDSRDVPRGEVALAGEAGSLAASEIGSLFSIDRRPGVASDFSRDLYLRAVERVIEYIHAGDIFQANLSQRLLAPLTVPPLELYARLRQRNPATFAGYFTSDDWAVVSASPERFLCVRQGEVETRPIKGTRRRMSFEADLYTGDELRESEKDRAENVMIVDLMRNDLSRVCQPGTLRVPRLCQVESYETVQHLVSEIRGRLSPGKTAWDLLAASFPGGSITGAPKVRAMEIIRELEPTVRGPYCGSLFALGADGSFDSSILIRTLICRKGWVQCPVGGGIVAQSDPHREYEETWHKAEGMLRALN